MTMDPKCLEEAELILDVYAEDERKSRHSGIPKRGLEERIAEAFQARDARHAEGLRKAPDESSPNP